MITDAQLKCTTLILPHLNKIDNLYPYNIVLLLLVLYNKEKYRLFTRKLLCLCTILSQCYYEYKGDIYSKMVIFIKAFQTK